VAVFLRRMMAGVLDLLQELHCQGKTVVIVTHSDEVAKRAELIIRVKDGLIAESLDFE